MKYAVFSAFLVIQHELHGNACVSGPIRLHGVPAVADQVAWVLRFIRHGWMSAWKSVEPHTDGDRRDDGSV